MYLPDKIILLFLGIVESQSFSLDQLIYLSLSLSVPT